MREQRAQEIIRLYVDERMSAIQVAKSLDTHPRTVRNTLDRYGIKKRTKLEGLTLRREWDRRQTFEATPQGRFRVKYRGLWVGCDTVEEVEILALKHLDATELPNESKTPPVNGSPEGI